MSSSRPVDPNLICFEMVVKKGILLTFIMSADMVTSRYCSIIAIGMGSRFGRTASGHVRGCLPFRLPRSGPQIYSADLMSRTVMGQLGS